MQISIVYANYSNSTYMATEYLALQLSALGHTPSIIQAREATSDALQQAEAIILASPSWDRDAEQGMPHEDFDAFAEKFKDTKLPNKPMAILGLGDSSYTYFCGAVTHLQKLIAALTAQECIPALKIDGYYLNEQTAQSQIQAWATQLHTKLTTPVV